MGLLKKIGNTVGKLIGTAVEGYKSEAGILGTIGAGVGTFVGGPPVGTALGLAAGTLLNKAAKNADKMPWPLNKVLGAVNTGARWAENTLGTVAEDIKRWPMEKELEYLKSKLMTLVFSVVKMLKGSLEKETEKNAKIARAEKSEKDKSQAHGLSNEKNKAKDHEKSKERLTDRANTGKEKTVAAMSKSSGKELSGAAGKSAEAAKAIISKNPAPKNINLGR